MALIRSLTISTITFERMKEKFYGFRQTALDRNVIVKSHDQDRIWLTAIALIKIYRINMTQGRSRPMKGETVTINSHESFHSKSNMLESYDSTITLRSNGNQALQEYKCGEYYIVSFLSVSIANLLFL